MPMLTPYKQSGIAPIAVIVVVVLVAAAAGGYFLLNKGGGVSIPGAPGLTLNPNCKYNDPDLCKFINNFKITNSYSAKSTTTDKAGKKFETTFEGVGEDRSHIVYSESSKETYNVITIGDTTYTKDYTDNKWWKQKQPKEAKQLEQKTDLKEEFKKSEVPEDKTTYKKIGMEACGSRQCFKYQIIDPNNTDTTEYIWFDSSEYLLRRERSESKDGTVTDTDINYSGVSINVPSPTKDAKPDQIILPTGGTVPGMTEEQAKELQKAASEAQKALPQEIPPSVDTSGGE